MLPQKPRKTLADWLVIGLSPVLVMLLVGSLAFFLIDVFYRGGAVASVRWVLAWFVLAVVLVTRISIEQGPGAAMTYGVLLGLVTWGYLVRVHPAYLLGAVLLAVVWWCAHQLTRDCTLVDEDEDASGEGLLANLAPPTWLAWLRKKVTPAPADPEKTEQKAATPHAPGRWVVWFSAAALPLFGLGQMLLPAGDLAARSAGFQCLFVYVAAALGLLLTTSFLGLRRYLRQRYLTMPPALAWGWVRFGIGLAAFVLLGALLLPRPGFTTAWQALSYRVDTQLRRASDYALQFNPHGQGPGQTGTELDQTALNKNATDPSGTEKTTGPSPEKAPGSTQPSPDSPPAPHPPEFAPPLFYWLKALFWLVVAGFILTFLYRNRDWVMALLRDLLAALRRLFAGFHFGSSATVGPVTAVPVKTRPRRFAAFQNPFLTGQVSAWPPEKVIFYSYEALQAWAAERGWSPKPEQTAREFCRELGERCPEITPELQQFSRLHGQAAYGATPPGEDLGPVKSLWQFLGG